MSGGVGVGRVGVGRVDVWCVGTGCVGGIDDAHHLGQAGEGSSDHRACTLLVVTRCHPLARRLAVRAGRPTHRHLDLTVEVPHRIDRPERQRLMQGEVVLQIEVDPHPPAQFVRGLGELEQTRIHERSVDRDRAADVKSLAATRFVVVGHQPAHRRAAIARPIEQAHHHLVVDVEAGGERLGVTVHQPIERLLVPMRVAAFWRLLLHELLSFLGVGLGLLRRLLITHHVFRRLGPHVTTIVETLAPGTAGDLLELSNAQHPDPAAVVLAQLREQHRTNRHVDPDAERVGATDDLQQTGLCQTFDEQPILGEQAGMVHTDTSREEAPEALAEWRVEPEAPDQRLDLLLLILGERAQAQQSLRRLGGLALGEMHEIDGGPARRQQLFDRVVQRGRAIGEVERYRPIGRRDQCGFPTGPFGEVAFEERRRTEGRRHQEELAAREFEQRKLPGPAALRIRIEVELVGDHDIDRRIGTVAQRPVGQNLCRATDDRCIRVDAPVAGHHADAVGAERAAQFEELLRHQRLDRCGVHASLVSPERQEVGGDRDQRLARAGRGVEDHVVAGDQFEGRLLLSRIQVDPLLGHVGTEPVE